MIKRQNIQYLASLPPEWPEDLLPAIRRTIASSADKIVILDDDPTGTQTVHDLPVLTHWSVSALVNELQGEAAAFFILTNSRSLTEDKACALAKEIGSNLQQAMRHTGVRCLLVSRSDSTLRGHFPAEVDAMAEVTGKSALPYLILPFFLEGGRYTVGDIHYVQEGDTLVPAAETMFARDRAFGFINSNLKDWVVEKSSGNITSSSITSVTIEDIRRKGPQKVAEVLRAVPERTACIVNAASYRDMEVVVSALLEVEREGKEFLYRTAASFVRCRTGMDHETSLLTGEQLRCNNGHGGLFIIGSYVNKTSSQLAALLADQELIGIEMEVDKLLDQSTQAAEIRRVTQATTAALENGYDCAVFTSRKLIAGDDAAASLAIGQRVSNSLIEVVRGLSIQPSYLVAKGGITSSDVATKGLGVVRAMVIGQPLPGVPAWRLGPETRYPDMAYIVFPGNVGEDDALVQLRRGLKA